jgi:hypothetical protein
LHVVDNILKDNWEDLLRGHVGSKRVEDLESKTRRRIFIDIFGVFLRSNWHNSFNHGSNQLETTKLVLLIYCSPHEEREGHNTKRIINITVSTDIQEELNKLGKVVGEKRSVLSMKNDTIPKSISGCSKNA